MIPELLAWRGGVGPAAAGQILGSPGLELAADSKWIQECMNWNQDQDRRQDNKQGHFQKAVMKKRKQDPCDSPALN